MTDVHFVKLAFVHRFVTNSAFARFYFLNVQLQRLASPNQLSHYFRHRYIVSPGVIQSSAKHYYHSSSVYKEFSIVVILDLIYDAYHLTCFISFLLLVEYKNSFVLCCNLSQILPYPITLFISVFQLLMLPIISNVFLLQICHYHAMLHSLKIGG